MDNTTTTTTIRSTTTKIPGTGCHNGTGGGSCCSSSNQCLEGEGDCDDNVDCKGNLICGDNNCNQTLGFGSEFDCCYNPNNCK